MVRMKTFWKFGRLQRLHDINGSKMCHQWQWFRSATAMAMYNRDFGCPSHGWASIRSASLSMACLVPIAWTCNGRMKTSAELHIWMLHSVCIYVVNLVRVYIYMYYIYICTMYIYIYTYHMHYIYIYTYMYVVCEYIYMYINYYKFITF